MEEKWIKKMQEVLIEHDGDTEAIHARYDDILIEILREQGFNKVCDLFESEHKYYA